MKQFILITVFVLSIYGEQTFAQTQIGTPSIIPPSPEAAAINRYADIPVTLYTGTPNIEIPLYTLKCGYLTLPISISYYASGIKVEDYSTWIGIGWTLNAGGVISRSIRGLPDSNSCWKDYLPISSTPDYDDFTKIVDLSGGNADTESDIYYYNFNGHSGAFYIKNGIAILKKYDDIAVTVNVSSSDETFVVKDKNGIKYYFSGELKTYQNDCFLKKIVGPNCTDTIYFEYNSLNDYYIIPPRNSNYYRVDGSKPLLLSNPNKYNYRSALAGDVLKKIYTSRGDSIVFVPKNIVEEETTCDNYKRTALDLMQVYSKTRELIKSFKFYTNSIETINPYSKAIEGYPPVGTFTTSMNYRVYLDGIKEVNSDESDSLLYKFTYYGRTPSGKDSLPNTLSFAQDWEGFYNGQQSNASLVPKFDGMIEPEGTIYDNPCIDYTYYTGNISIAGANREPNFNCLRMGTLRTITYPTGGSAKFYYTPKIAPITYDIRGLNISKIEYIDRNNSIIKSKLYSYSDATLAYNIPTNYGFTFYCTLDNNIAYYPYCNCVNSTCAYYNTYKTTLELSPGAKRDLGLNDGAMIGYGQVTEYESGNINGYSIYTYSNDDGYVEPLIYNISSIVYSSSSLSYDSFETWDYWPLGPYPNNNWKRGCLLSKKVYDNNNTLKQTIKYNYSFLNIDTVHAIKILPVKSDLSYLYYQYDYLCTWTRLDSVNESIDSISSTTTYKYDSYNQIKESETTNSKKEKITSLFYYPYDINKNVYSAMTDSNMLNNVIEKTTKVDNNYTNSVLTTYKSNNGNYVKDRVYTLETNVPLTSFTEFDGTNKDNNYGNDPEIEYTDYDEYENPLKIVLKNGTCIYYVWAYNHQYPVAKIESGVNTTIDKTIDESQLSCSDIIGNIKADITYLNELLKEYINDNNYRVSFFTYKPLVGMTSSTDPRGITTYYEYDTFNRLKRTYIIEDGTEKTIQSYDYHYQGE